MKYFRNAYNALPTPRLRRALALCGAVLLVSCGGWAALEWKNVEAGSAIESALYRWMPMPVSKVLGLRPPGEAVRSLGDLIARQPTAELYSLRAMNEEASLDFASAESDWKKYVETAPDGMTAQVALADFYHRRLRPADEVAALSRVARAPAIAAEKLTPITQQRSWQAFERILTEVKENGLPNDVADQTYRAWLVRYPQEKSIYSRYFQFLLEQRSFAPADKLIAQYHTAFAKDDIFPVKARALLEYKKGSVEHGLAVYDQNFQPLWPEELVRNYFDLMKETRSLRKYLDNARAALERNPDDLNAAARIFFYYQQQGRTDAAQQTLAQYRIRKQQRNGKWSSQELYTLAKLSRGIRSYPEAARYYYTLYSSNDRPDAQELALTGLADILLEAPEQGVRLGSGELSMYRDIGTMDAGPGFLNGILSLVLNSTSPQSAYFEEESRAVPYFHRAKASELIRLLDSRFANSLQRPALHARLVEAYSMYGESEAVIRDGKDFLASFPTAAQREQVALLMADGYARTNRTQEEFAVYDSLLSELANKADNIPLGNDVANPGENARAQAQSERQAEPELSDEQGDSEGEPAVVQPTPHPVRKAPTQGVFSMNDAKTPETPAGARSQEYSRVLERYLSRLVSTGQLPQALTVLRKEIDRNPNDPGLYERLAQFLDQNRLGEQQEEVYQRAIQKFPDRSWYHKLARFYLRQKRDAEFGRLSEQVVKIFSGTELEQYFTEVSGPAQYYVRLNEFARLRFPHDLVFVRNLLIAYKRTMPKWEQLLRENWWQAEDLRDEFFEHLSRTGKLDTELATLRSMETSAQQRKWTDLASGNPMAARMLAEGEFWRSHYEQGSPLVGALASVYPSDVELGRRASAAFRSLAAYDSRNTELAIAIEENLHKADPGNRYTLARIGDILADRELFDRAAPYWDRMATVRPGQTQAYLEPATIYWDYYNFDAALRLLGEGRKKLGDDTLYAYEEGAIYEGRREYPQAIAEYVRGALKDGEGSRTQNRLLDLARRAKFRDEVDRVTANLADGATPELQAVKLRIAILESQNRSKDLEAFLFGVAERTTSLELLEWLEATAQQKSLVSVQQRVLERQAAVTTDPIRRLELRYSLVRFYEGRKDLDAARRNLEALYRDNPRILGVVRSTVDFYWRNRERQRAIDVLLQASKDSYPDLRKQFSYEAARKQTETGQYGPARMVLTSLLADSPYNDEYLAAVADTYARAGDDAGLKTFYLQKIDEFKKAPLAQDVRNRQIAALRRGLIPALTRMKDYAGATDQYIEIINRYPEDEALVTEAALYTERYQRQKQLLDFYAATIKQSPRDYRWPMVLARTQTQLENYPAAIEAYTLAIKVRPDRVDLHTALAELHERLMRFDEAAADYKNFYELDYKNTRWMEKLAEIRARQGDAPATVSALQLALIDKRPEKPSNYFEVARRLESWGMLAQARDFAQKGVDTAGRDLLAVVDNQSGAQLYVRVMTRLRQQDAAFERLKGAMTDADSFASAIGVVVQQVEKNGLASVTDQQWRDRTLAVRRDTARSGMTSAMREMGAAVARYFTPEEKLLFEGSIRQRAIKAASDVDVATIYIPLAKAAQLADSEALWTNSLMLAHFGGNGSPYKIRLVELQSRRLRFKELGEQLERYAPGLEQTSRDSILLEAAQAYRSGAEYDLELKVLANMSFRLTGDAQQRYFELLLQRRPNDLVQLATLASTYSAPATQYAVGRGNAKLAQQAVMGFGHSREPVWTKAYVALTGLYFVDRGDAVKSSFLGALGDATIGERVGKQVDRSQQITGTTWFYYGSRYGEYQGVTGAGDPEDFLPAILEQSPGSASGYITTAEYYADAGKLERAIQDYAHTLELAPGRADIHDRMPLLYWRQQKRAEAIAEWKVALEMLDKQVNMRSVPASFWPTLGYVLNHVGNRKVLAEVRPQANAVLRDYVRHNGNYQAGELLRNAYLATGDPQAGVQWLLELAGVAPDPAAVLVDVIQAKWMKAPTRGLLYERLISLMRERADDAQGYAKQYAEQSLRSWQTTYARYLLETRQFDRAEASLQSLPAEDQPSAPVLELQLRLALERNQFDSILEHYRSNPEKAPASSTLRAVALMLRDDGYPQAARRLFELVFTQEISAHNLSPTNLLGLAEIRLQDGDTTGAMELLRRLTQAVGQPFENLDAASSLLIRTGHHAEAVEFLSQQVKAAPWDVGARLRLMQEQIASGLNTESAKAAAASVAADSTAAYSDRTEAAGFLASATPKLGSAELDQLARGATITAQAADLPYFYAARIRAAEKAAPEESDRLLRNALNDTPERDTARLPLFRELLAAGRAREALAAIEPLLTSGFLQQARYTYIREERAGEPDEPSTTDVEPQGEDSASRVPDTPAAPGLTGDERARIAADIGRAYFTLEEFQLALRYLNLAHSLETSKAASTGLDKTIANVRAAMRRKANNALRQPMIHDQLEQEHVVHPQIVATATIPKPTTRAPASSSAKSKGGAQ